jgi:hypothetical protein
MRSWKRLDVIPSAARDLAGEFRGSLRRSLAALGMTAQADR